MQFYYQYMNSKASIYFLLTGICILFLQMQSCSTTKFVPGGEYLLANAGVNSDTSAISSQEMQSFIKQKANFKTFTLFKFPLFIYNLAGRDSTKWINRTFKNAGENPVIYDSLLVDESVKELEQVMINKGYLNAVVTPEVKLHDKKADVIYNITSNTPFLIDNYAINIPDSVFDKKEYSFPLSKAMKKRLKTNRDSVRFGVDSTLFANSLVEKDMLFDLNMLDKERDRIKSLFRRIGYYDFDKEHVGFLADTTQNKHKVAVDLVIHPYAQRSNDGTNEIITSPHKQYWIEDVTLYVDYNPIEGDIDSYPVSSEYARDGYTIKYSSRGKYIKPHIILNNCYIRPGSLYSETQTTMTYNALSQLTILRNVNITYTKNTEDSSKLHCVITCVPDKRQGISAELEGTNSGGSFGIESGIGYLHRNTFRGSELFNVRLKGAYEAISPSFSSFDDNYFEIGGETSLTFPRFMFPFLNKDFRRGIHASTQYLSNYSYQRRPGYFTRTVFSTGIKYIWQDRRISSTRHAFDLIELSYVRIPYLNSNFSNTLTHNARQYNFTDQFILGTGYTFTKTGYASGNRAAQPIYSLRASVETAGNALALVAKLTDAKQDPETGAKKIFGTQYVQYAKGVVDYSRAIRIDEKNTVAWRLGGGVAFPYGNFKQIPIQKRFFSGGANSVRGWGIRELGPGSFTPKSPDYDNFFYHSGDIRLDGNIEYRSKLFWILEMGAFVDAGNIWTVRNYADQDGGKFQFDQFYKEIALAWGVGLRFDFDFVLIRLDCGWKAYDPSKNSPSTKWPILQPHKIGKNTAWHIAVGYPF